MSWFLVPAGDAIESNVRVKMYAILFTPYFYSFNILGA